MNPEDQVIADIDALIDEQLAAGEPETGYDYGDPDYPDCPHEGCWSQWHGEPTGMCPGSAVLGPLLPHRELVHAPTVRLYDAGWNEVFSDNDNPWVCLFQRQASMWPIPDDLILGWVNPARPDDSPWERFAAGMNQVVDLPDHEPPREDGRPPLPRPSHTPPMWAVDANRSHRRRNH